MNPTFIFILIRLSIGREDVFRRCLQSIRSQTFTNLQMVISYDDDAVRSLIPPDALPFKVLPDESLGEFYYNDYCNALKSLVIPGAHGWFMFLDSDDYLASETALEEIAIDMQSDNYHAIVCQMSRDNGKIKPDNVLMSQKRIKSGKIGLPCLLLRSAYKDAVKIGVTENADFEYIKEITDRIETKYVKKVVVHSPFRRYGL